MEEQLHGAVLPSSEMSENELEIIKPVFTDKSSVQTLVKLCTTSWGKSRIANIYILLSW